MCDVFDLGKSLITVIEIDLLEAMAKAARQAELLTSAALDRLLTEAIRRQAAGSFLSLADQVAAAGIPEMSMEEINAEVKALRAERRARDAARRIDDAGYS